MSRKFLYGSTAIAGVFVFLAAVPAPALAQTVTPSGDYSSTNALTASPWNAGNSLTIGNTSTGTLSISAGGQASATNITFGAASGSNGNGIVSGTGSSLTASNNVTVGGAGQGSLSITGGATASFPNPSFGTNAAMIIGASSGSNGTVTVDGAGSSLTAGQIVAGYANGSSGSLVISDGGSVNASKLEIGGLNEGVASNGNLTVTGSGSTLTAGGGGTFIGGSAAGGSGNAIVQDGATVDSSVSFFGFNGATGSVTVTGAGSNWNEAGAWRIGYSDTASASDGTVNILNGATATVGSFVIVGLGNGNSALNVSGAGSSLTTTGGLGVYLGYGLGGDPGSATGTMTLSDGGTVNTAAVNLAPTLASGQGTVNIGAAAGSAAVAPGTLNSPSVIFGPGTGVVYFNHNSNAYQFSAALTGGALATSTVNQLAGTTILTADNSGFAGTTNVSGGVLRAGAANAFSPSSAFNVTGGLLDANGISQTIASLRNAGTVATNAAANSVGTTFTVDGAYVGQGGTLVLNTVLGGSGSATDELVLNGGSATGSTGLRIVNAGGTGALTTGDGIEVVSAINGATTTSTAFKLSAPVDAGAYEYNLYDGGVGADAGNQNYYLRSAGFNSGALMSAPYETILNNYAEATLGTLEQRTGNRIWPDGSGPDGVSATGAWARVAGQYTSYNPKTGSPYNQSIGFAQFGSEGVAAQNASGMLTAGAFATFGESKANIDVNSLFSGNGAISTTGYGAGVNLTYLGNDGLYVDGVGQFTWYVSTLTNKSGRNQGYGTTASLESGKRYDLANGLTIVPQAQLVYSKASFDSFADTSGAQITSDNSDVLLGRAGVRLEKFNEWTNEKGQPSKLQVYGIANLNYLFLGPNKINVAGTQLTEGQETYWGEIGLGGTYAWNASWSLYGEADYANALSSRSSNYAVKGDAGVRCAF